MFRLSGLVSIAIAGVLGGALFWTSQSVQRVQDDLAEKRQAHSHEEESLRVLDSEWSYLNRPDRVEALISGRLDLNAEQQEAPVVLQNVGAVPEPVIPAIPMMKPQYIRKASVNSTKQIVVPRENKVIQSNERNSFNDMLDSAVSDGGAQ